LLVAPAPRALGGLGLGTELAPGNALASLRVLAALGRGNLAVGRVYEGHMNALQLIQTYGTPAQQETYAADARAGKLFGVWNTEASDGVRILPVGGGRYRLEGSKTFTSGAGYVARALVPGALETPGEQPGWQMCVAPMDEAAAAIDPSWWRPLGMRASASYRVDFTGVELDADALIGAPGDYYRQPLFSGGAIRFAAVQLGAAAALFDLFRAYLRELGRTDDPYQRQRAGEVAILVEGGELWLRGAASVVEDHADAFDMSAPDPTRGTDTVVAYVNMARTAIEGLCLDVMRLVERSVGARGLLRPYPFERIHRDLTLYLRQPAPDAALAGAGRFVLDRPARADALWRREP